MLRWYPGPLLRVVLELTYLPIAFLSIFAALVLVQGDTQWSIGSWQGPGASADFWKILALLTLGWTLLALGWRGARPLFKWLIGLWHAGLAGLSVLAAWPSGQYQLRGEAIGFSMSIGVLAPVFTLATLACTLLWLWGDRRADAAARRVSPLQRRNKLAGGMTALGLLVGGLAIATGFEELGVIACFGASLSCRESLRPLDPSAEIKKALFAEGSAPR